MSPWHQHIARIKELSRACVVPSLHTLRKVRHWCVFWCTLQGAFSQITVCGFGLVWAKGKTRPHHQTTKGEADLAVKTMGHAPRLWPWRKPAPRSSPADSRRVCVCVCFCFSFVFCFLCVCFCVFLFFFFFLRGILFGMIGVRGDQDNEFPLSLGSRGRLRIQSWCRFCIQSWRRLCIQCFLGSQA